MTFITKETRRRAALALFGFCVSLVGPKAPLASTSEPKTAPLQESAGWVRVGVVVAARTGLSGDKPLQYAYSDGERLQRVLRSLGQMSPEHLHFIRTESAAALRAEVEAIGRQIVELREKGRKVLLQFYYTGHGGGRNFHLGGETVDFGEVKTLLERGTPEARIYVLDVCQGASFFASKGFQTTQPVRVAIELDKATKGEVTISSSASEEQAYEVKTLGGSIFTSHWEMALRGAGDRNRDGQVTLFEAYNYAYDQTVAFSRENLNLPQHPSFSIDLTGAKDLQLTRPDPAQGGLLFRDCPVGTYSLLDIKRGIPVGEMRIPEAGEYALALEPGLYRVDHVPPRGLALTAQAEVSRTALTLLEAEQFVHKPRAAVAGKGSLDPVSEAERRFALSESAQAMQAAKWELLAFGGLRSDELGFRSQDFLVHRSQGPDPQRDFGVKTRFKPRGQGMTLGLQTLRRGAQGFQGGFQFRVDDFDYALDAVGRETTFGGMPGPEVRIRREMHVTPLALGVVVARPLLSWGRFALAADASASALHESMRLKNTFASVSTGTFESEQEWSGWGYALEAHVLPSLLLHLPGAEEWVRFGLRLGAGYQGLESVEGPLGSVAMPGTWAWRAALQIGLVGGQPW